MSNTCNITLMFNICIIAKNNNIAQLKHTRRILSILRHFYPYDALPTFECLSVWEWSQNEPGNSLLFGMIQENMKSAIVNHFFDTTTFLSQFFTPNILISTASKLITCLDYSNFV